MIKNVFFKFINHFIHPLNSFFFDIRKIYWIYAKFYLTKVKRINFPTTDFLINIDYIDLLNLWLNITRRKPAVILEVGSGYSTFLIVEAIKKLNKKGNLVKKFYSLEQNKVYLNLVKKNMNKSQLQKVTFILTGLKIKKLFNRKVSICTNFPKDKINFFYEDRSDHSKFNIAGDALNIEKKMPANFSICVDGMKSTVNFYKKHLKRKYKLSGGIFSGTNFEPVN
jgi:hypothetical protein